MLKLQCKLRRPHSSGHRLANVVINLTEEVEGSFVRGNSLIIHPRASVGGLTLAISHLAMIRRASSRAVGFDLDQRASVQRMLNCFLMMSFTYRCPRTGQEVHGHVVVELINGQTYELVTCTACSGTHLIKHKTGRLLERANQDWQAFRAS
jgi:hypothetical protein